MGVQYRSEEGPRLTFRPGLPEAVALQGHARVHRRYQWFGNRASGSLFWQLVDDVVQEPFDDFRRDGRGAVAGGQGEDATEGARGYVQAGRE